LQKLLIFGIFIKERFLLSVKRKILVYSLVILIIGTMGAVFVKEPTLLFTDTSNNTPKTVIVDAGHGGFDGGAVVNNVLEKDINLKIADSICNMLQVSGFKVICTRKDDSSTESDPTATISARKKSDLNNRLKIAKENSNAIFISIHLNKFSSPSVNGAQMFYSTKNQKSKSLAECLKQSVKTLIQPDNNRTIKAGTSSTFLLHHSPIPTVIAECGFMSNPTEFALLQTEEYQSKMAFSIFCGILNYFNS
jgi:N-acetylmuramoyl-L-alanine amidase